MEMRKFVMTLIIIFALLVSSGPGSAQQFPRWPPRYSLPTPPLREICRRDPDNPLCHGGK
uniref:Uncharacterized protein n=1 Tax=Kalanchoe fedtschenkoi TaxID=63787 RepID=A0A7N0TWG0_KALFE